MIKLKSLKTFLRKRPDSVTARLFLNSHTYAEAYFRRLLFIGLRLKDVRYGTAHQMINQLGMADRELVLEAGLELLSENRTVYLKYYTKESASKRKIKEGFASNIPIVGDLEILFGLFRAYTSGNRDRLYNGATEGLSGEELETGYFINWQLLTEFERVLKKVFGLSAFEKPSEWGAVKTGIQESVGSAFARLGIRNPQTGLPALEDVREQLARLKTRR